MAIPTTDAPVGDHNDAIMAMEQQQQDATTTMMSNHKLVDEEQSSSFSTTATTATTTTSIDATLPKCELPPREDYEPVESLVAAAVESQQTMVGQQSGGKGGGHRVSEAYGGLIDTLRSKNDLEMVKLVLLALRTSGQGKTLMYLTQSSKAHLQLVHLVVRLNPFELTTTAASAGDDNNNNDKNSGCVDYGIVDAQLHLLIAIVSANSVFLVPTLTSFWRFLTAKIEQAPVERYGLMPMHSQSG